jgi:hypothetical protein
VAASQGKPLSVKNVQQRDLYVNDKVIKPSAQQQRPAAPNPGVNYNASNRGAKGALADLGLGFLRSGTGTAQSVSGIFDLVSPGKGTNRFSKGLDEFAKQVDERQKMVGENDIAYKLSQAGGDVGTIFAGGGAIKGGIKAVTSAPKVASVISRAGKIASKIPGVNKLGFLTRPDVVADVTADAITGLGQPASKGEQITAADVAINTIPGAVIGGGQELIKARKAIKELAPGITDELADEINTVIGKSTKAELPKSVKGEFTTASGVKSKVDQGLVDVGLIKGDIFEGKLNDLVLGPNTDPTEAPDMDQVAKYIDDISNGRPIEPIIVGRGPNGEFMVDDGRHRLEALQSLGIEDVPLVEKVANSVDEATTPVSQVDEMAEQSGTAVEAPEGAIEPDTAPNTELGQSAPQSPENASESVAAQKADEIVAEDADEPTRQAVQEILDSLNNAEGEYDKVSKVRTKEKAQKIAKGTGSYESAGGGEAGFRAKLGSLKGKQAVSGFEPIQASEKTQTAILDDIEKSDLRPFEKLNTQNAIRKIWGANESKPTTSDINYIRKYFGDDLADTVKTAIDESPKGWKDVIAQVAGTPRALLASFDLSFGGRQGAPVGARHIKEWTNANIESVKYAGNSKYFQDEMKKIEGDDSYETVTDLMGVRLPAAGGDVADDAFANADYASAIPGVGKGVDLSDRAYSGGLTKLRFDLANKIIEQSGGIDQFTKTYDKDAAEGFGRYINTFTGSGGKKGGLIARSGDLPQTLFWAPRKWAGTVERLNPKYYYDLYKANPKAAKLAMETQASFIGTAGVLMSIAAAAGAEVGMDPRSADFGKIKLGNTRYDILGGLQQDFVAMYRFMIGEKVDSETGEVEDLDQSFFGSRKEIIQQYAENKLNPLLGLANALAGGGYRGIEAIENMGNLNPFENTFVKGLATPLGIQGVYETFKDTGNIAESVAKNVPSFFGVGVQTYGAQPAQDVGKDGKYTGKITDDMVMDGDQPVLDDKGRPIKIKFPKDATDLEKQALMDDKRKSALSDQYRRTLSSEDQALLKLTQDQLKGYVDDGKITQERYDQIQQYHQDIDNVDGVEIPEGVTSELGKQFYRTYNSKSESAQKKWLAEAPDETAKTITELLNKERVAGLPEFKPSNELSKAYAEYEKDLNTHPDYSAIDKQNKAKEFQKYVYKLNYSSPQREVFTEGSSSDLRALLKAGSVSKDDLNAAIQLDNELFNSGLSGSLKFSKKFRNEFGYGVPSGKGGSGGGSGGSGDGDTTKRAYLSALLPGESTGSSGKSMPKFSSKRRSAKGSVSVAKPKKSSKKISINL